LIDLEFKLSATKKRLQRVTYAYRDDDRASVRRALTIDNNIPSQLWRYFMSAFGQIVGRLGQDPAISYTNGGTPVVNLSVASNRQRREGNGERVNVANWFKVTVFGRDAEVIAQYALKGSALAFNGRLQTDSYVDREGHQRISTYLIADSFEFMPSSKRSDENLEGGDETDVVAEEEPKRKTSPGNNRRGAKVKQEDTIPF
jgi:single-strand DNA-binding protein